MKKNRNYAAPGKKDLHAPGDRGKRRREYDPGNYDGVMTGVDEEGEYYIIDPEEISRPSDSRTVYTGPEGTSQPDRSRVKKMESIFIPRSGKRVNTNKYMLFTSLCIILLFAGMIVYLVRFTIYDAPAVITSPYNKRTTTLAANIRRGTIMSANDEVLARTDTDDEGHEYREYPYENIFAHVVGYVSHGKGGLESALNYELLTSHEKLTDQFKKGITGEKKIGDTIYTTLDTRLQKKAYDALEGREGAIVAIEPKTGKVKAMVSKPDFDPNAIDEDWEDINSEDGSSLLNRAITGIYPPGSTYKLLTALAYIEEKPGSYQKFTYNCKGETIINSVHIHCYKDTEHGREDLGYAFAHSCNTAFVTIGSDLNLNRFLDLNKRFLFNSEIKFDLPVKRSRVGLTARSAKSDIPQAVIGQGDTLVTPFHNALMMCGIANGGILMEPTLIDHIESINGTVISRKKPREWKRIADDSDAAIMTGYLRQVVTDGTGKALDDDDYTVAGKTGTAENGKGKDHSWFVGFSNVKDPDLVVCVLVEHGGSGSDVAAPIADEIFESYYSLKEEDDHE